MRYIVIETNIDRKVPPDDRPSNLPAMEQDHAEHVASALNSRLGWDATRWWVARPETAIAAPAPTDTRANFEAHFQLTTRQAWQHPDGGYKLPEIQAKWEGWQAGLAKAAPTEQEPVEYQHRMRATWRNEGEGWTPWEKCSAGHYEDCIKTPLLHDWQHEVRKLYTAPVAAAAPGADERKPVAWHVTVSLHDDVMRDELTQAEPSAEHMRRLESAGYETTVTPLFR